MNEQIRLPEIRVIDAEGKQLGILQTPEALKMAEEQGLDLVEIAPTSRPPVCKIMDFGKFKYEQSKKARESRKKQHTTHLKEIKIRPKIEEHDLQFKLRNAEKFLTEKDKVKITVIFRGREMEHMDMGTKDPRSHRHAVRRYRPHREGRGTGRQDDFDDPGSSIRQKRGLENSHAEAKDQSSRAQTLPRHGNRQDKADEGVREPHSDEEDEQAETQPAQGNDGRGERREARPPHAGHVTDGRIIPSRAGLHEPQEDSQYAENQTWRALEEPQEEDSEAGEGLFR